MRHVAQDIMNDVPRRRRVTRLAAHQIGVEIQIHQLRVVIQHLLEMRHQPLAHPRNTAQNRRRSGREFRPPPSCRRCVSTIRTASASSNCVAVAQQKLRLARLRKFRRVRRNRRCARSYISLNCAAALVSTSGVSDNPFVASPRRHLLQLCVQIVRRNPHMSPCRVSQSFCDLLQHVEKTRPAVFALRRKIRPAKKRLADPASENNSTATRRCPVVDCTNVM